MSNKQQRRKGNLQTASSARAAQLVQQSSGMSVPFIRPESTSLGLLNLMGAESEEIECLDLAPEFRIVFKKLMKRDFLTREKAIKEMLELAKTATPDQLKLSFQYVAPLYQRLITGANAVIRTWINAVLQIYLNRLKKEAPHAVLKQTLPLLIFSTADSSNQVTKSANEVLNSCFPNEKMDLLYKHFSEETVKLSLEIITRKHKLMYSQQSIEEESSEQTQSRLIAQSFNCINALLAQSELDSSKMGEICAIIAQSASGGSIMSMGNNVKSSAFQLAKRLIQTNAEPFTKGKFPSSLLNNLDSADCSVCRTAFECFFILSQEDTFFLNCSLEKAIIPKFLSLIRKKGSHWDAIAPHLLSAFSIIFIRIGNANESKEENGKKQAKLALSFIDSFFDGPIHSVSMESWSNAFIEICQYFVHKSEECELPFVTQFFQQIQRFSDFVLKECPSKEIWKKLAEFLGWMQTKLKNTEHTHAKFVELYSELEEHFVSLLPSIDVDGFFLNLLDLSSDREQLSLKILSLPPSNIRNALLLKSVQCVNPIFLPGVLDIVSSRLRTFNSDEISFQLLRALCRIHKASRSDLALASLIDLNNLQICLNVIGQSLSEIDGLLNRDQMLSSIEFIFNNLILLEKEFDQIKENMELILEYICEKCFDQEFDQLLNVFVKQIDNINEIPNLLGLTLEFLIKKEKLSIKEQRNIAEKIFVALLRNSFGEQNHVIFTVLQRLECNSDKIRNQLNLFLCDEANSLLRIKQIASFCNAIQCFKNATASALFLPSRSDVMKMAHKLDYLFSTDILSCEDLLAPFCLLKMHFDGSEICRKREKSTPFDCLLEFAKFAVFYAQFSEQQDVSALCYSSICCTLISKYKLRTSHSKQFKILSEYSRELNLHLENRKVQFTEEFANYFIRSENGSSPLFPFCALYTLINLVNGNEQNTVNNFTILASPILQQIFSLAIRLRSKTTFDISSFIPNELYDCRNSEGQWLLRWLVEFECRSASFNESNRAENFVSMAQFIEEHRSKMEDWLFTVSGTDLLRDAISCLLLKFCAQMVPFLAELGGPIRDFFNCGLITALQNCTENVFVSSDQQNSATDDCGMRWLLAHFSLSLICNYESCVNLNNSNQHYIEIGREWTEFFGPSVDNYILHWFLQFAFTKHDNVPQFFIKSLCKTVHSLDMNRLLKAEMPSEFAKQINSEYPIRPEDIFDRYPEQLRLVLVPNALLLFDIRPEVQFAAANILKGSLFKMFSVENSDDLFGITASTSNDGIGDEKCEENFQKEEEQEEEASEYAKEKEQKEKKLPTFFKKALNGELNVQKDPNIEPEIDPILLAWDSLIRFLAELDVLSRVQFCEALDFKLLSSTLAYLFNALPDQPGNDLSASLMRVDDLFSEPFRHQNLLGPFDFDHFVCNLYFRTLSTIPALVRDWFSTLGKAESIAVNQYTKKYVARLLIQRELRSLENMKRGKLEIRVLPKVHEVECSYRMEESTMRLSIFLPENYPIGAPKVETGRSIVSKDLHRKWLLQLGLFLNRQNGAMIYGLLQWKRSIDQHLKGVEDCTICMSTVSSTNYQLPRIRCRQCKKKFHGDCLYKWFQTSSKSSCPLCRANFV